jgi:baculoviral IAP repeat-containing protein 6
VIASFINPLGTMPAHFFSEDESSSEGESEIKERPPLPASFPSLLQQSCLLPALSSYLRNDSGMYSSIECSCKFNSLKVNN